MNRIPFVITALVVFILLDLYSYYVLRTWTAKASSKRKKIVFRVYWGLLLYVTLALMIGLSGFPDLIDIALRQFLIISVLAIYAGKILALIFLIPDELIRGGKWIFRKSSSKSEREKNSLNGIQLQDPSFCQELH